MRIKLLSSTLVSLLATSACVAPASEDLGDDTDGMGSGSGSGSGSGATTVGGWTALDLLDDTSDPDRAIYHKGNDRVTGIYFESADKGLIVTQGDGETFSRGGAVFTATSRAVTSVAFSGDDTGLGLAGPSDFTGLARTPSGYIAMAYANDVIASRDGGATFTIERNGDLGGIEPILGVRVTSSGTTLVRKTGVVDLATSAPSSTASYTDVWAPNATSPVPATIPAEQCQNGPLGAGVPTVTSSVYISTDRNFIAYTANPAFDPEVCISTDGGWSFYSRSLAAPAEVDDFTPTGVTFTSATHGIAWFGAATAKPYIRRTIDGGMTWTTVAVPSEIAPHVVELPAGFFAPDGMHGWLAGFDQTQGSAIVLATTDAGASWSVMPGVAAAVDAFGGEKLYSGFAIDATHIWLGGERGLLMHN